MNKSKQFFLSLTVLFSLLLLVSCGPRNTGLGPVQVLLDQRSGNDAYWRLSDGDAAAQVRVAELLSRPLGPEEAVEAALLNNADLQAVFEELEIARSQLVGAGLPPNLHLHTEFYSSDERLPSRGIAAMAGISDLLFLPQRRGVAAAGLEASRIQTAGTVLDFTYLVRNVFYDYQAAEQLLELAETVLEAAAASYDVAWRLREAGNITALDLANERAFHEEARIEVALAEAAALQRREELNALMGLTGMETEWLLAGRLAEPGEEPPELGSLEGRAIEQSLELLELEQRYTASARRANLARAEGLLPSLRAGIGVGREGGLQESGPVISLELPIFDRGQAQVGAARAEMRQLEQLHRARAVNIRAAVRAARNELVLAAGRAQHYREVLLPLREEIMDQTQRQYNAMQIGVFQLITAKRDQIRTGEQYVTALHEYWRAKSALNQILAGRLVPVRGGGSPRGFEK